MSAAGLVSGLQPPYWAVIFTSRRRPGEAGYGEAAARMVELAQGQPGFLGVESVREADGLGITVSYWASREAIDHWRRDAEHRATQARGRAEWYEAFELRVCQVERGHGFVHGD